MGPNYLNLGGQKWCPIAGSCLDLVSFDVKSICYIYPLYTYAEICRGSLELRFASEDCEGRPDEFAGWDVGDLKGC